MMLPPLRRAAAGVLTRAVPGSGVPGAARRLAGSAATPATAAGLWQARPGAGAYSQAGARAAALAAAAAAAAATIAASQQNQTKGGAAARCEATAPAKKPIVVVGSVNADIIVEITRFPKRGETLGTRTHDTGIMVPGGKGANQAVAAARLSAGTDRQAQFVCQFGNDSHARKLQQVLGESGVDLSGCGQVSDKPSGQAFIFLEADGSNSILIVGGSNVAWPPTVDGFAEIVRGASAVLLQREIPEYVNEAVAQVAHAAGVPVIQDVGGEERPFSDALLSRLSYICPNETELARLSGLPTETEEQVVAAAKQVQGKGVKNVLVTLGEHGAVLVQEGGQVLRHGSFPVPGGKVVDTTGAGDCFRAAFAVALVEGRPLLECLRFAAAAGAVTVSRLGAIPSLPSRQEVETLTGAAKL